jgi:hypothetical protein
VPRAIERRGRRSTRGHLSTERGNESLTVFDVFKAARTYLGEVQIEGDVGNHAIAGEWLVTTGTSAADHAIVQLWRPPGS